MQQPDSLVGLVVILAAKNGIKGVLAQQGGQACNLFAVEQLGGGSPRSLSPWVRVEPIMASSSMREDLHL